MKTIEQKAKKVPTIRFAGFEDEWVNKIFRESFTYLQNNTLSRAELNSESGLAKNIHYGDVLVKFGECIDVAEEKIPFVSDAFVVDKFKNSFLQDGDIVIADTAEDETVGKCTEMQGVNDAILLSGLHTIPSRPKEKYGSKFLGYYLNSSAYRQQLLPLMQGVKVLSISKSALQETNLVIPKDNQEQQKIGSFFSNIDSLILLEQKKYDKLMQVKKSMLEKMFPKEGATVPEIRFAGFSGDWVWKELDDIIVRIATGLNPRDNFKLNSGGSNYYVTIKNFEHGHLYLDEKCDRIDDCALQLIQARSDLQKDDLLFSSIGRIGDCYLIKNNPQNWNINESVFTLRPNKAIAASNYLFHVVHCDIVLSQILDSVTGSTFKSIKIGDLKKALIPIPCKEEQIQIANYLDNLDSLVSLQQRKLEKLKNIKKSLLEKMFV